MSLLRPALRPALNPITKTLLSVSRRFFTQFDDVAESSILLNNSTLGLVGSAAWEINFVSQPLETPSGDGFRALESDDGSSFIKIFNSDASNPNLVRLSGNTNANFSGAMGGIDRTALNHFRFIGASGGLVSLYINGVAKGSANYGSSSDLLFNKINSAQFGSYGLGVIANIKIWTGGDKSTGTLVFDMPINQNYTPTNNTVIDRASGNNGTFVNVADGDSEAYTLVGGDWVGSEDVLSNISFVDLDGDGLTQISDREYSVDVTAQDKNIRFGPLLAPNSNYLSSLSVSGYTGGGGAFDYVRYDNADFDGGELAANGKVVSILRNTSNNNLNVTCKAGFGCDLLYLLEVRKLIEVAY